MYYLHLVFRRGMNPAKRWWVNKLAMFDNVMLHFDYEENADFGQGNIGLAWVS